LSPLRALATKTPMSADDKRIALADDDATAALGARLAGAARAGDVLALRGPLGAGKTALARAFIKSRAQAAGAADLAQTTPSPTFTLAQVYPLPDAPIWHFDFYRIADPEEIWELGWEEALAGGVSLVEWPERAEAHLSVDRLDVRLTPTADDRRDATLTAGGPRGARLLDAA